MKKYRTREQRLEDLQEFTKIYNRLPLRNAKDDDERSLAKWVSNMKNTEQWQPVIDICNTFDPSRKTREQRLEELQEFVKIYNRLPKYRAEDDDERSLAAWVNIMKNREHWQSVVDICDAFDPFYKSREQRLEELQEFIKTYNRLPRLSVEDEKSLADWVNIMKNTEQWQPVIEICNGFKSRNHKSKEERLEELQEFVKIYNRLPKYNAEDDDEKSLARWVGRMKTEEQWQSVIDICNAFEPFYKSREQRLEELQEFTKIYNRLPLKSAKDDDERSLAGWMKNMKNEKHWQPVIDICNTFEPLWKTREQRLKELQEFVKTYNRLPRLSVEDEKSLAAWIYNMKNTEQWQALIIYLKIAKAAIMGNEVAKKLLTFYQRS